MVSSVGGEGESTTGEVKGKRNGIGNGNEGLCELGELKRFAEGDLVEKVPEGVLELAL